VFGFLVCFDSHLLSELVRLPHFVERVEGILGWLQHTMMSSRRGSCSSADSSPDDDLFRHVRAGQSPGQAQAGLHSRRRLVMDLTARENMDYFRKQEHGYKSSGHLRAPTRTGFPAILRACGRWGKNLRRRDAEGDSS
jgi:hypothetical protein